MNAKDRAIEVCKKLKLPEDGAAYVIIREALIKCERDTRHACAEAVLRLPRG